MTAWTSAEESDLRRLWQIHGGGFRKIAKAMGRSRGSIDGKSRVLGLQFHGGRARALEPGNAALVNATTIYPGRVIPPDANVLKSGDNQRKLGRVVTKGKWKGFPIFSLTLEERATCPRTCLQWAACYANGMPHAKRYQHGEPLEAQIYLELSALQIRHPVGFVVRLHIAGDFMSVRYVHFWCGALDQFPALHVFGYTAWQPDTEIGREVVRLRSKRWDRFAIRTSGASKGPRTMVVADDAKVPKSAIVCPAQSGATTNCATCGLCWAAAAKHRPIAFHQH